MSGPLSELLRQTIDREIPHLRALSDERASVRPKGPKSWSPKEELGHLIDSAANNHQRFVRGALEPEYRGPGYYQNKWVTLHGYSDMPWTTIVEFWYQYNGLMVAVLERSPEECFSRKCFIGSGKAVTLGFVVQDYVVHLQHHVDHVLSREVVTAYPQAPA